MKRYAFAGASGRALYMYAKPMYEDFKDCTELVGVFDINSHRSKVISEECGNVPVFNDFDEMLFKGKPDIVIVTTVDRYHHEYIIRSLEAGCDVIVEKPLTIDADKCNAILEAEKRTGREVVVTFNYRFVPYVTRIKELIESGIIGDIINVDLEWMLDTNHGADYFRRWHRRMENSGGLLVHKSTHHFDMINWWLKDEPEEVHALGARRFYGDTSKQGAERCRVCPKADSCEFFLDIAKDEFMKKMYLQAEKEDGYFRDKCVFSEEINIYDTMAVQARYSKGAFLSYSLIAHSPYEGWKASINGAKGRIEAQEFHSGQNAGENFQEIKIFNRKNEIIKIDVLKIHEIHGGADEKIRRMIFRGGMEDPLGHLAGTRAGVMSSMIGIAANMSIQNNKSVRIKDLIHE